MNSPKIGIQGLVQAMSAIQERAVIEAKQAAVQAIAQLLRQFTDRVAYDENKRHWPGEPRR